MHVCVDVGVHVCVDVGMHVLFSAQLVLARDVPIHFFLFILLYISTDTQYEIQYCKNNN